MTARRALAALLFASVTGCGFMGTRVTRVYSGREHAGPYLSPEAYAHYTQAVAHERGGKLADAIREYRAVLLEDDSSPDVWARLGAVECRTGQSSDTSFARAEALDAEYAPLWRERAACALARGDAGRALAHAQRAVALDPDDDAASLSVVRALVKLGRRDDAERWLWALWVRDPASSASAEARRATGSPPREPPPDLLGARRRDDRRPTVADVDRALAAGELELAKRLARGAGLSAGGFSLHAVALGRSALAKREAARALDGDPNDADALIAAACAASLDGDPDAFDHALRALGPSPLAPSGLGVRLFRELLARRVGPGAAEAWQSAWALAPAAGRLEAAVDARSR
ncbi:MAG: tetratricopeptide repeat protein [Polyangiaceae bacterium]|nr:tetratricopeptide repeat protein [Polyangiaceae bacterium]